MRSPFTYLWILCIVIWCVWNLIDRPLDPDFAAYMAGDSRPSYEQNGYLAFMGMDAPVGADPHTYGLDTFLRIEKELEQSRMSIDDLLDSYGAIYDSLETLAPSDAPGNAPPAEHKPVKPYVYDSGKESLSCWTATAIELIQWKKTAEGDVSCMTEADLIRHLAEIDVLLGRYEILQKYPRFYELHSGMAFPEVDFIRMHEYYMARNTLLVRQGKSDVAMRYWLSNMKFIDTALADQQTIVLKAILNIMLSESLANLKLMIEIDPSLAQRYQDQIIAALSAGLNVNRAEILKAVFRSEYQMTVGFLDRMGDWTTILFFKKNATANILVAHYRDLIDAAAQPPADLIKNMKLIEGKKQKHMSVGDGFWGIADMLSYNPMGKILIPPALMGEQITLQFPWRYNARRRMLILYVMARAQGVAVTDMPAFLAGSPVNLHDPFTQKPFAWDAERKTIYFIKTNTSGSEYDERQELSYP